MQNLQNELKQILQSDERLVIDGKLTKNKIVELALAMDEVLIGLLLENEVIKRLFFKDINGVLVFDKVDFQRFVSNKQFLPDNYTAFKNKIGLTANEEYLTESKEVVLAWPYKDCVLEGGQTKEDQKRKEIFWNETLAPEEIDRLLAPKVLTNFKKYDKDGEHEVENLNLNDNLIIKGNNLLALHSLKNQYAGKVKLIYIDPPYNTGSDSFGYNDSFNHSTWLTFIRNRLEVAKSLLCSNGVICISCDDGEEAYLKVLTDEIFGRSNFINNITYERSGSAGIGQGGFFVDTSEFILIYTKNKENLSFNEVLKNSLLDYQVMKRYNKVLVNAGEKELITEFTSKSNGLPIKIYKHTNYKIDTISLANFTEKEPEIRNEFFQNFDTIFRTTNPQKENSFQQDLLSKMDNGLHSVEYTPSRGKYKNTPTTIHYNNNEIFAWLKDSAAKDANGIIKKNKISTVWSHGEIPKADLANEGGVELKRGKKPEQLLYRLLELSTKENDIVLDFHLGSGTTCAVAHKMGRTYIGIEQLDYDKNDSVVRLNNVIKGEKSGISKLVDWQGGGSFIYCELSQHNANIIDKIEQASTTQALKVIWQEIENAAYISYKVMPETINENIHEFEALSTEEQKQFLISVLDKNQLYINYSEIADEEYQVAESDKRLNNQFYGEV